MVEELAKASIGQPLDVVPCPGCYLTHDVGIYHAAQVRIDANSPTAHKMRLSPLPALQLWAYMQSVPEAEHAIAATGKRDVAFDVGLPLPVLHFRPGDKAPSAMPAHWGVTGMMDQYAYLKTVPDGDIKISDTITFDIPHPCLTFDKWRQASVVGDTYNVVDVVQAYFQAGLPMANILVYGEALIEFNQVDPGSTSRNFDFGGDASNFYTAAARQGTRTGRASVMGVDHFGQVLRGLWQDEDVDHTHVYTDIQVLTGLYFISHNMRGHHFDHLRTGSATGCLQTVQLPLRAIAAAKAFHLSRISLAISDTACDADLAAMAHTRATGVLVSFDTNFRSCLWPLARARAMMWKAMHTCSLCLPSQNGVTVLLDCHDRDGIADALFDWGVKLVVLKMGAEGCYVVAPKSRTLVPRHTVNAIDATGTGGYLGESFVVWIVAGDSPIEVARYAGVVAAISTTGYSAVAPIPRAGVVRVVLVSMQTT